MHHRQSRTMAAEIKQRHSLKRQRRKKLCDLRRRRHPPSTSQRGQQPCGHSLRDRRPLDQRPIRVEPRITPRAVGAIEPDHYLSAPHHPQHAIPCHHTMTIRTSSRPDINRPMDPRGCCSPPQPSTVITLVRAPTPPTRRPQTRLMGFAYDSVDCSCAHAHDHR